MPWYKGWSANLNKDTVVEGFTLYDALEKLVKPPKRFPDKPVRIPINGIYKIKGVGDVITGRIEQGTLTSGDVVRVVPRGLDNLKVFSIEMHHKTWPDAKPGDNIGMNIKGLDKPNPFYIIDFEVLDRINKKVNLRTDTKISNQQPTNGKVKPLKKRNIKSNVLKAKNQ